MLIRLWMVLSFFWTCTFVAYFIAADSPADWFIIAVVFFPWIAGFVLMMCYRFVRYGAPGLSPNRSTESLERVRSMLRY